LGKKYPRIFISFTISPYNYNYLYETTKLFYNIVDAIVFSHLNFITPEMAEKHEKCFGHVCSVHPSSTSTISDLDRMDEYVLSKEIKRVKNNFPDFVFFSPDISSPESIRVYYKQPEVFLTSKQCLVPWVNAQILPNGDVIPASRCFHLRLGNIVEDKFTDIWRGEAYQLLRKELSKIGSTPACSRCCGIF
jgi:MoaA/NifB/PqqE/SkfB family radical SAM enzyme